MELASRNPIAPSTRNYLEPNPKVKSLRVFCVKCIASLPNSGRAVTGVVERLWKTSDARLVLEDGSIWRTKSFGARGTEVREVVFNTSLKGTVPGIHPLTKNTRFANGIRPIYITKVAEQSPGLFDDGKEVKENDKGNRTLEQMKAELYQAVQGMILWTVSLMCLILCHQFLKRISFLEQFVMIAEMGGHSNLTQGINRGIFGVQSAKKSEIHGLVALLESLNPTPEPAQNLEKVGGCWKLLYSTITILGSKRTKLGLRDFITLGDFFQNIDVAKSKAVNVIKFNVRGLNLLNGQLAIEASFKTASKTRVDINYEISTVTPDQLMNMFRKNYDLLLSIFKPDGWLEITYVDDNLRIGRDGSGNIFILERSSESETT